VRGGLRRWLRQFHVNPRDALESELRQLEGEGGGVCRFERPYGGYAQYAVFGRTAAHGAPDTEALATS
jgi:S-adenosylmethionine-diacylgycerolhomoserine-N-methlytransferase